MMKEFIFRLQGIEPIQTITVSDRGVSIDKNILRDRLIVSTGHFPAYLFFPENFMTSLEVMDLFALFDLSSKRIKKPTVGPRKLISRRFPMGRPRPPTKPTTPETVVEPPVPSDRPVPSPIIPMRIDQIYHTYKNIYDWNLLSFFDLYFFHQAYSTLSKISNVAMFHQLLRQLIQSVNYSPFEPLVLSGEKKMEAPQWMQFLIHRYATDEIYLSGERTPVSRWYHTMSMTMKLEFKQLETHVKEVTRGIELLDQLPLLSPTFEKIIGKIQFFVIPRTTETTGHLFDRLHVTSDYPSLHYKMFWKLWIVEDNEQYQLEDQEDSLENHPSERSDPTLHIFDKTGRLTFIIKNETDGLSVQGLFLQSSSIPTPSALAKYLHLPPSSFGKIRSLGVMTDYLFEMNHSLDPSILAFICMNEPLFHAFFRINDTEKISRSNHSLFLYFYGQTEESTTSSSSLEILVGGWNRIYSRFGDLTCILYPLQSDDKRHWIHVKITRSKQESTVLQFIHLFGKLLSFYQQKLSSYTNLFKELDPSFRAYVSPVTSWKPSNFSSCSSGMEQWKDTIFGSIEYTRACQAPKPIMISESEAKQLPSSRVLQFPPQSYQDIKPQWFTCNQFWKGKQYSYPGLIHLDNPDNRFGYAPCCYIENHDSKNQVILRQINYWIEKGYTPEFEQSIDLHSMLKVKYRTLDSSKRIIQQIGQHGKLSPSLEQFMKSIQVFKNYTRMGTSPWKNESLLGVLEFVHAIHSPTRQMRSPQTLRELLLQTPLEVGLQQNFEGGISKMRDTLLDPSQDINPRQWIRVLEEFYNTNIFILSYDSSSAKEDSIHLFYPTTYGEYAFPLQCFIKHRPILFILEHQSIVPFRYELIVTHSQKTSSKETLQYSHPFFSWYFQLVRDAFQSYLHYHPMRWTPFPFLESNLQEVEAQTLDVYGKTRYLYFSSNIMCVLLHPISPLPLPTLMKMPSQPSFESYQTVFNFLKRKTTSIKKIIRSDPFVFFYLETDPIVFISSTDHSSSIPPLSTSPSSLPLSLRIFINTYRTSTQYNSLRNRTRLINILLDTCLCDFSQYIHEISPSTRSPSEIVRTFIDTYLEFKVQHRFPSLKELHPRRTQNAILYSSHRRFILLQNMRKRIHYFLEWFLLTKPKSLQLYRLLSEIPSFYSSTSDFKMQYKTIIQIKPSIYHLLPSTPYLTMSLSEIQGPELTPLYYYNPEDTPEPTFYHLMLCIHQEMGQRYLTNFLSKFISPPVSIQWIPSPWSTISNLSPPTFPIYCFFTKYKRFGFLYRFVS